MVTLIPERVSNIHANIWRGNFPLTPPVVIPDVYFLLLNELLNIGPDQDFIQICLTDNTGELDYLQVLERTYRCKFTRSTPPFADPTWDPRIAHQQFRLLTNEEIAKDPLGEFKHKTQNRWVIWWPIEGGTTPDVTGPGLGYNFAGLIAFIGRFIDESDAKVYIHCLNGTDRTGAVAAALAHVYKDMNADEAIAFASSTPAGTMDKPYLDLVRHFCQ
jgi:hypothetical protein